MTWLDGLDLDFPFLIECYVWHCWDRAKRHRLVDELMNICKYHVARSTLIVNLIRPLVNGSKIPVDQLDLRKGSGT